MIQQSYAAKPKILQPTKLQQSRSKVRDPAAA